MLTNTQTVRRYNGPFTEGQKIYFDIAFIQESDLELSVDGEPLEQNSGYTVQAVKSDGLIIGANITITSALPNASVLVVQRNTAATQEQDYPENGPFESIDVERGFDKLTMKAQEIEYREGRFIKVSDVESDKFINTLPPAVEKPAIITVSKEKVDLVYVDPHELEEAAEKAKAEADRATQQANAAQSSANAAQQSAAASAASAAKAEAAAQRAEEISLPAGQTDGDVLTWDSDTNKPVWDTHIATTEALGFVKPDGTTTFVNGEGSLSAKVTDPYVLPIATKDRLGGVRVDGKTIFVDEDGVLSAVAGIVVDSSTPAPVRVATPNVSIKGEENYYKMTIRPVTDKPTYLSLTVKEPVSVFPSMKPNTPYYFTSSIDNRQGTFTRIVPEEQIPGAGSCRVWLDGNRAGSSMFLYGGTDEDLAAYVSDKTEGYIFVGYIDIDNTLPQFNFLYDTPPYVIFENTPV